MSLNVKNKEAHRLAQELSTLTGESMAAAVTEALRERLNRLQNEHGKSRLERILKISRDCATRLKGVPLPDHGEFLYDEKGLPK